MTTHSSILAWEIPQRSLAGYSPWGRKVSRHNLATEPAPDPDPVSLTYLLLPSLLLSSPCSAKLAFLQPSDMKSES